MKTRGYKKTTSKGKLSRCHSFSNKKNHDGVSFKLIHVPLKVMIAMGPLYAANGIIAAPHVEETPITLVEPKETLPIEEAPEMYASYTPEVQQSGRMVSKRNDIVKAGDGTSCMFSRFDADNDSRTIELMSFHYSYSNSHFSSHLRGVIFSMCPMKQSDGTYLITYSPIGKDGYLEKKVRLCRVPEAYGKYLFEFAKSQINNGAVKRFHPSSYRDMFGNEKVQKAPKIKDEINMLRFKDSGKEEFIVPPSEPPRYQRK